MAAVTVTTDFRINTSSCTLVGLVLLDLSAPSLKANNDSFHQMMTLLKPGTAVCPD